MLVVSLALAIITSVLMLTGGISVIGKEPVRLEASHAALGTFLALALVAPAIAARILYGGPVITLAAAWLTGWMVYGTGRMILRVGRTPDRVTPVKGLVFTVLNLSHLVALSAILFQVI